MGALNSRHVSRALIAGLLAMPRHDLERYLGGDDTIPLNRISMMQELTA